MHWQMIIGLEVHVQLNTASKLFSSAPTDYGALPNTQTSFIDAALPGVLPVVNEQAIRKAIQFGLATNAHIHDLSFFERKNYFYPDLPKGYQISQLQKPIITDGHLKIFSDEPNEKKIHIVRAHLEEDAGKSLHERHRQTTGIDLNRAGTPLLEIVTAPCLYSVKEVEAYLKALHQLVRFLGISDGNMQEGSFRCDVNISLKPADSDTLGTRTELKNLNSFRFIEKAIIYEQHRQQTLLESGEQVVQETRFYAPATDSTHSLRQKESAHDYRYFPDPDLLPIHITQEDIAAIKETLPPLPAAIRQQLRDEDNLQSQDIMFLLSSPATYNFYQEVKSHSKSSTALIMNWLKGPYAAALNTSGTSFENPLIEASILANLLDKITSKELSSSQAKRVFNRLLRKNESIDTIITQEGFQKVMDTAVLRDVIKNVINKHPKQVDEYQAGKEKLLGFFVGKVMQEMKGRVDPVQVNDLLREALNK